MNIFARIFGLENSCGPVTRLHFGAFNYTAAGARDRFCPFENALRSARPSINAGAVYKNNPVQTGGVRPGDSGMMRTRDMFYGVLRANLRPSGIQPQTYLWQNQQTPMIWSGDAPLQMQAKPQRPAPWLRRVASVSG